jgi:hypothetical protein
VHTIEEDHWGCEEAIQTGDVDDTNISPSSLADEYIIRAFVGTGAKFTTTTIQYTSWRKNGASKKID